MGNCCKSSAAELVNSEEKVDTAEEQQEIQQKGFVQTRRCTDIFCLVVWVASIVVFLVVSFYGMQDGNPHKLYQPRDYQGAFCGIEQNWNNGPALQKTQKLTYMMNVSTFSDTIAKQFACSTAAKNFLMSASGFDNTADREEYLCECCLSPCAKCSGSLSVGGDLTGALSSGNMDLVNAITGRMSELTDPSKATQLFSTGGMNMGSFNTIWTQATKYFVKVCATACQMDISSLNVSQARSYTYEPHPDELLSKAWARLKAEMGTGYMSAFTFKAYPLSMCPYPAENCVPLPGLEFAELSNNYCTFKMGSQVVNAVGSAMASTFETLGGDSFAEGALETFGAWWGDFQKSIDTFILVGCCCFIIGLIYLVVLRFTIKICVWFAVFVIFLGFGFGGGLAWVRAVQCKNTSLFDTAHQTGVAVVIAGSTAANNLVNGAPEASEACTGDCADYRGMQTRTRSGILCQGWDETSPHDHSSTYSSALYPQSGLNSTSGMVNNYCRNPYEVNVTYKASTIWCFTTSTDKRWELCTPIGIITPQCAHGYEVPGEQMRKALEICGYILWAFAGIWAIIVCCIYDRIRLAIRLNQVAARFVGNTPTVLLVPVVQAIVGVAWVLVWCLTASFLLSQVPDAYTPKGYYESYAIAYGTATVPGVCTDKWPTGFVWKDAAQNCDLSDGVPKCWRCAPPRFVLDWRFAIVFFNFLWNNAFLIALGQCMIAGAVGVWFFTPNSKKGSLWRAQALRQANWNVWRYHAGSMAFGSFILAVIQFIRYLMYYFEKQASAQKNWVVAMILKVVQCCIYCFERFIKFLNKNAYIQVAIRGTPFCTSARKAFQIILANMVRFGTVAILGSVIHFIGYIFIMAATLVSGYFLLRAMHSEVSPVIPMIIYGCMSYIVGMLFMSVFGLAVDTCLQCVIFAEEKCPEGDFVPPELRSVIEKDSDSKDVSLKTEKE